MKFTTKYHLVALVCAVRHSFTSRLYPVPGGTPFILKKALQSGLNQGYKEVESILKHQVPPENRQIDLRDALSLTTILLGLVPLNGSSLDASSMSKNA